MHKSTMLRKCAAKVIKSDFGALLVGRAIEQGRNAMEEISRKIGRIGMESVFCWSERRCGRFGLSSKGLRGEQMIEPPKIDIYREAQGAGDGASTSWPED